MIDPVISDYLTVRPLAGAIGAEVIDIDLRGTLSDATVNALRKALLDYGVIFFHEQELDVLSHKRFAQLFGEIFIHPFFDTRGKDPEVVMIERTPGDTHIVGEDWHSDTAMAKEPLWVQFSMLLRFRNMVAIRSLLARCTLTRRFPRA